MQDILRRINAHPLTFLGTLFLLVAGLSLARSVLLPIALAILFSFMLNPLVRHVQRWGLKRIPAVIVVSVGAFALLGVLLYAVLAQVFTLATEVPKYEKIALRKIRAGDGSPVSKFLGFTNRVTKEVAKGNKANEESLKRAKSVLVAGTVGSFAAASLQGPSAVTSLFPRDAEFVDKVAVKRPTPVVVQSDPMTILAFYAATARQVIRLVAAIGLVIVLTIVMIIYREELRDRFIRLTGSGRLTVTTKALDEASRRISDYMYRKTIVNGIFGIFVAVVLFAIGVPFAIMWGFLLTVLRFTPGLGIWLSVAPPLLLSLVAFESWWPFVFVAATFLAGELFMMNVFEPRFVVSQIGLLPVATMVSLSFWTWLWGPMGLLLAIPITMCLAVLGKYVVPLNFLSVLLSDRPAMDVPLRYYQRLLASDDDEATDIVDRYVAEFGRDRVSDELLIPALSCARRDLANNELTETELEFIFRTTDEIVDDLCAGNRSTDDQVSDSPRSHYVISGCPVGDQGDQLSLRMLEQKLLLRGHSMQIGGANKLSAEMLGWVEAQQPDIVCLACVGPGGLAQTRFACKRIRSSLGDVSIVIARLGEIDDFEKDREVLKKAGADWVSSTVEETSQRLIQAAQHLSYQRVANK